MALIVGGTTVTGTQVLDATKLLQNLPALDGSSLTNISSSPPTALSQVGAYAFCNQNSYTTPYFYLFWVLFLFKCKWWNFKHKQ